MTGKSRVAEKWFTFFLPDRNSKLISRNARASGFRGKPWASAQRLIGLKLALGIVLIPCAATVRAEPEGLAEQLIRASGVTGGLIVHLGCGDGRLTSALHVNDAFLVRGLGRKPRDVNTARQHIQSLGQYGPVSVARVRGARFPFSDSLVNLLVIEDVSEISMAEAMRVLAPRGVAMISGEGGDAWATVDAGVLNAQKVACGGQPWTKVVKPWPETIDEWTHYLYDAGGNPVGKDREFGPPKHLRWTAGPRWARNHGWTPSVTAMVSAQGRLFYILDETTSGMDAAVPAKWCVMARDAFSGIQLWKHPIRSWGSAAFSGTPDNGAGVPAVGRFTMPPHAARRLVAVGDTVYVTLGPFAPVTALDARTGEIKRVYAGTGGADEILWDGGRLLVTLNPARETMPGPVPDGETPPPATGKDVGAVDAESGKWLWRKGPFAGIRSTRNQDPFGRLELCAGDGKVFALTDQSIECLDAQSGNKLWTTDRPALSEKAVTRMGFSGYFEYLLTTMSYRHGVVLLAQPEPNIHHTYHTVPGTLHAFDAATGAPMWRHGYGGWGHQTPPGVFVVGDLVWTHVNAEAEFAYAWGKGYRAKDPSQVDYRIQALNLRTGKLVKEYSTKDVFNVGHHHRCYRNRITERYLLSSRRGVEFVDLATGENYQNHWVRSGCQVGNLPCNGLLYVTPHPCGCYVNAKLTGFNALSADEGVDDEARMSNGDRLAPGPGYNRLPPSPSAPPPSTDWPTYRHDASRSGATDVRLGVDLLPAWETSVGAKPSAVTVGQGMVFVSAVDAHTVHALDAATGTRLWQYTVDARVDSPPTFHRGLVIFGSRDGRVYCLRAADGTRVWRFRAAPKRRWISAFGQLESAWPVPGSVLIQEGKCWFAAGRSSYLDGGIRLYALDPPTGKVLHEEVVYSPDPQSAKMAVVTDGFQMTGLLNDIPGSDGRNVFIRQQRVSPEGPEVKPHLFSTAGYLDSTWFNRTFWRYGAAASTGLMVRDNDMVHGIEVYQRLGADSVFHPGAGAYRLRCFPAEAPPARGSQGRTRRSALKPIWEMPIAIRGTAMIRTAGKVFVAGAPDIVDRKDPHGAWEGRKGGMLAAYDASGGTRLAEWKLPSPPVWDGMAAAEGGLYVSTMDGFIRCFRDSQRATAKDTREGL